jgi:hypothetical protein
LAFLRCHGVLRRPCGEGIYAAPVIWLGWASAAPCSARTFGKSSELK